jgi:YbbR domain-containing protein
MKKFRSFLAGTTTLLLSLLLAIVIWFNAVQAEDPDTRRSVQIPVTYVGLPENVVIVEPENPEKDILITYEGRTSIVTELGPNDFSAIVDLSGVPVGEFQQVPVQIETSEQDITVNPPTPDQIDIFLEELKTVEVPVRVDIRGSVARGHTREQELIEPAKISVTGRASDVDILDFAQVTVFLNGDNQTIVTTPQPIYYDRQGRVASVRNLDVSTNEVQVTVPIHESADFAEKIISVNIVGEPAPGYRLISARVNPSSVLVTGSPTRLLQPFSIQTEPIDITGLTESFSDSVTLILPAGIEQDEVEEITVNVQIEPFRSTKIFNQTVTIQGLEEDKTGELDPETVRVVLFGPSPVLEAMTEQEILVNVDAFGLEDGTYNLEPIVTFPEQRGLELRSVQPSVVSLMITDTLTTTNGISNTLPITDETSLRYNTPVEDLLSLNSGAEDTAVSHQSPPTIINTTPQPIYLNKKEVIL